MLQREKVLRLIDDDWVEPIQEVVRVEYDNDLQLPLGFRYGGRDHEVLQVIGTFRQRPRDRSLLYLVQADTGVYALMLKLWDEGSAGSLQRGQWVLHFRVQEEEEVVDRLIVDLQLKLIADFHGHLCPDLVIGYRACCLALESLGAELSWSPRSFVIAENATSALDAVQRLTHCTLGNSRLMVRDVGKHGYTFASGEGVGLRLVLRPGALGPNEELVFLEERVESGDATIDETVRYQALIDARVAALLYLPAPSLFESRRVEMPSPRKSATSELVPCALCGELVIGRHLLWAGERRICRPCFESVQQRGA